MMRTVQNNTNKTTALQLSISDIETILKCIQNKFYRLPLYHYRVSAGKPKSGETDSDRRLELNEYLIKHPDTTFFLKVSGTSMIKAGIHHNDILIVDRSIKPENGNIVIASLNGELTVKRLHCDDNRIFLIPENNEYHPIEITDNTEVRIWGVATSVIHSL